MRKNKKGVSGVVVVVIMIALVMAAAVIVWTVINRMIEEKTESTESCFGNFGKVTLNSQYTCYNSSELVNQFSITIGDIDVDSVLVSISAAGETKGFEIPSDGETIVGLTNYGNNNFETDFIVLPGKNSGKTYQTDFKSGSKADMIEIAPIIGGHQCGVSDSTSEIEACSVYQLT